MKTYLPLDARNGNIAAMGKNGSGKTTTIKAVLAEPLLAEGKHVCVVDPTSAWWGLRTSADGKGPGFKVLVLGGDHGDLPLPANGGAAVARLLVEQRVNVVLDTGNLTVGERTRWMIEFAGTIYRLNRTPLYLVLDEAHVFAPQGKVPDPDTGKMLHAVNQIAAGGRSRGIRLTMITQRPQKLHKDALTTADTLIAMRVLAPQDREAVKAWIDGCGDPSQGREVLDSLAGLQRGEGWVWYPEGGFLQRTKFPAIKTFDSSSTPKDGEVVQAPRGAAEIDLSEIKAALADAVKEAEANDPKVLRKTIAELRAQLKAAGAAPAGRSDAEVQADLQAAEDRGRQAGYKAGYDAAMAPFVGILPILQGTAAGLAEQQRVLVDLHNRIGNAPMPDFSAIPAPRRAPVTPARLNGAAPPPMPARREAAAAPRPGATGIKLPPGELAVLTAAAQFNGVDRDQLSVLTGYKRSSRDAYIQRLREKGFLEVQPGGALLPTQAGIDALGADYEPLPTGDALLEYWRSRLPDGERRVLDVLVNAHPDPVARDSIDQITGYKRSSRDAYLQRMKSKRLVEFVGRGEVQASRDLFS